MNPIQLNCISEPVNIEHLDDRKVTEIQEEI